VAQVAVDPGALRALADQAAGLADQVAELGVAAEVPSQAVLADPGLVRAVAELADGWRARCTALSAELHDASAFLQTVADAFEGADAALSGGA
jgi:uncharacterized protein YukE